VFSYKVAALYCVKRRHGRHVEIVTVKSKIRLRQSIHIYWRKNPAKFHPDPIRNDGVLGFFKDARPNIKKKNKNKLSSDMRSISDMKILPSGRDRYEAQAGLADLETIGDELVTMDQHSYTEGE